MTEKVGRVVQRFSYGNGGPYAGPSAGDGKVFGPSQAGAFEGADSTGVIRPPSIDGGVYDRASPCDALCDFVAGCFSVAVPANCGATCDTQVRAVASEYGVECTSAVLDFYSCIASALVCGGELRLDDGGGRGGGDSGRGGGSGSGGGSGGDDDDDDDDDVNDGVGFGDDKDDGDGFGLAPDFLNRCGASIAGLLACVGEVELDDGVLPGDGGSPRDELTGARAACFLGGRPPLRLCPKRLEARGARRFGFAPAGVARCPRRRGLPHAPRAEVDPEPV